MLILPFLTKHEYKNIEQCFAIQKNSFSTHSVKEYIVSWEPEGH